MEKYQLTAKTFAGLEPILAQEIENLGGENVLAGRRVVFYDGDLEMIYRSNYYLRTALRVLRKVVTFSFSDADQFYLRCREVNWLKYMNVNQSLVVNSTVSHSDIFRNSMFASLKVKDAIVDYFRNRTGKRPDVDTQDPDIYIDVHISGTNCTLSLDSSGESLHRRGYRVQQAKAPLNEVLAAGMILLSGWDGSTDFIDPMCGSGTLPIEAAMIAQNLPPARFRKRFAFENWPGYNPQWLEEVKMSRKPVKFTKKIYASDISRESMIVAQTNARRARLFSSIEFQKCNMKELQIQTNNATIIINPPYGERVVVDNIFSLYAMIGERLKHQFAGNTAWILTSSKEYLNQIGLKPMKKMTLYNGALECIYASYTLFSGKRVVNR